MQGACSTAALGSYGSKQDQHLSLEFQEFVSKGESNVFFLFISMCLENRPVLLSRKSMLGLRLTI